jgi:hypothetical protein
MEIVTRESMIRFLKDLEKSYRTIAIRAMIISLEKGDVCECWKKQGISVQ